MGKKHAPLSESIETSDEPYYRPALTEDDAPQIADIKADIERIEHGDVGSETEGLGDEEDAEGDVLGSAGIIIFSGFNALSADELSVFYNDLVASHGDPFRPRQESELITPHA